CLGCRASWGMSHPHALITISSSPNNCRSSPASVSGDTLPTRCSHLLTRASGEREVFDETNRFRDFVDGGEGLSRPVPATSTRLQHPYDPQLPGQPEVAPPVCRWNPPQNDRTHRGTSQSTNRRGIPRPSGKQARQRSDDTECPSDRHSQLLRVSGTRVS